MTDLTNLIGMLASQALGGNQTNSGVGGALGNVLGGLLGGSGAQPQQQAPVGGAMGQILGSVLGQLGGGQQSSGMGGKSSLLVAVIPLVLNWIQNQGGLSAALQQLNQAGLSGQVQSWVSPQDQNAGVQSDQVAQLFNSQEVTQFAAQHQLDTSSVYGAIASVLPEVVNSLTPQGDQTSHSEANADIQSALNLLSGFMQR